ncbi:MAG: glycosyltransferase family 4 protein [Candidatus Brocadia sp.]|nr:glycosyltransferase family 4 protein [Candidatus Brocadia sp.]
MQREENRLSQGCVSVVSERHQIVIHILFVHQSAEMYGSDKVLLSLIEGLDKQFFNPIVILPRDGPLLVALQKLNVTIYVIPLVIISRVTYSIKGMVCLPLEIYRSMRALNLALKGVKVDIVHSNTVAVLSGALWAKWGKIPHIWHVHEMIVHPNLVRRLFPLLLKTLANRVVCNSTATQQLLLNFQPNLAVKSIVIKNCLERIEPMDQKAVFTLRNQLNIGASDVLVALVGRINRWKGQGLLVDAASILWEKGIRNIHYLIVGSPPDGREHFKNNLLAKVSVSPAKAKITVMDFREDIYNIWDASDIAVVPSTEPEPFGMVALEAMAAGKPVIAAAHGGIKEIIVDGETGLYFAPSSAEDLANKVEDLSKQPYKREQMGSKGMERLKSFFNHENYVLEFSRFYEKVLSNTL